MDPRLTRQNIKKCVFFDVLILDPVRASARRLDQGRPWGLGPQRAVHNKKQGKQEASCPLWTWPQPRQAEEQIDRQTEMHQCMRAWMRTREAAASPSSKDLQVPFCPISLEDCNRNQAIGTSAQKKGVAGPGGGGGGAFGGGPAQGKGPMWVACLPRQAPWPCRHRPIARAGTDNENHWTDARTF